METEPYVSHTEPEALIPNRVFRGIAPGMRSALAGDIARAIGDFQAALQALGIATAVRYPANSTVIEVLVDGR